jgi:hypothetical protein
MACPVNAVDITASAKIRGVTLSTRGLGTGSAVTAVSPISSPNGMSRVSSTCSALRRVRTNSVRAWVSSIRGSRPRPGAGAKVPGGNRVTIGAPAR